jgi:hypothetical protein
MVAASWLHTRGGFRQSERGLFVHAVVCASLYSLCFGFLEYYVDLNRTLFGPRRFYYYLAFVTVAVFSVTFLCVMRHAVSWGARLEAALFSIYFYMLHEDLSYFIALGIDRRKYPFPTGNWYDKAFWFLCGLGEPLPFFPHVPLWYLIVWSALAVYAVLWWYRGTCVWCRRVQRTAIYVTAATTVVLLVTLPIVSSFGQ